MVKSLVKVINFVYLCYRVVSSFPRVIPQSLEVFLHVF